MRFALPFAALLALFAAAPAALALTLQTNNSPAGEDTSVTNPNDVRPHLQGQPAEQSGITTKIGSSTFHFGVSRGTGMSGGGGNNWFLDSPASRTVPSQAGQ